MDHGRLRHVGAGAQSVRGRRGDRGCVAAWPGPRVADSADARDNISCDPINRLWEWCGETMSERLENERRTAVSVYTDGACSGNPGPGGWAAILVAGQRERELSGRESQTTNQRMELMAAIGGLRALKRACRVTLYSDSAYMINGLTQRWYVTWRKNGWLNSQREPVKNRDLWEELVALIEDKGHEVTFGKVKGHSGHAYNERCDALARAAIRGDSTG